MFTCQNDEGVHGKRKVGNPCSITTKIRRARNFLFLRNVQKKLLGNSTALEKVRNLRSPIKTFEEATDLTNTSVNALKQGFPNWGTCTPSDTFACQKGYI